MSEKEQELMNRYIYEVVRRVPRSQRTEITMELEELIGDMYEAGKGTMEEILIQLGDPKELAKKYQNFKGYLIGPEYFDNYFWVLKIVLLAVGASGLLTEVVKYNYVNFHFIDWSIKILVNTLINMSTSFAMVTLVFAVLEYMQIKVDLRKEEKWSLEQLKANAYTEATHDHKEEIHIWNPTKLSPIPNKKAMISRGETVVGVVFIMIFSVVLAYTPELFGAYVFDNGKLDYTIPIFNLDKWSILCPLILGIFGLAFIDEIIKLVSGCYCKLVLLGNIITNVLQLILFTWIFKFIPVWNVNFAKEVSEAYDIDVFHKGGVINGWGTQTMSNVVLAVIWGYTFFEIGFTIYKTMRYGSREQGRLL